MPGLQMSTSQLDLTLDRLRAEHEARSLYTVYRSDTGPYRKTDLASDLPWSVAKPMADGLDEKARTANPGATSWTLPLHFCRLQK